MYSESCSIYRRQARHRQHTAKHAKSHNVNRNDSRHWTNAQENKRCCFPLHPLPPPCSFLSPLSLQKWRAARLHSCPVGVVSSNRISWERAWRHASLLPSAVIIEIHYTLKMELLEPNCCRLNYFRNTLQPWHILIICSCSCHFLFHPLVFGTSRHRFHFPALYSCFQCFNTDKHTWTPEDRNPREQQFFKSTKCFQNTHTHTHLRTSYWMVALHGYLSQQPHSACVT